MMHNNVIRGSSLVAALAMATISPANAADTAATGVAAALGLTAGSGKTTIASGGGVGEAALLTSETLGQAGGLISTLVRSKVAKRPIFLLTHDQQIDLSIPRYVAGRIAAFDTLLANDGCLPKPSVKPNDLGSGAKPKLADVSAALATDTSISSIPLTIDDRVLITAIAMTARPGGGYAPARWVSEEQAKLLKPATSDTPMPAPGVQATFLVPGDMLVVPTNSKIMSDFQDLLVKTTNQRSCEKDDKVKGILGDIDAFVKSVTTPPDKGGPSQLGLAAELDAAGSSDVDILRVAIEQAGGTAVTRSNIWYELGFPGAAVVSASLITSFRLTDGNSGQILLAGFVRCAVAPVNFKDVPDALSSSRHPSDVAATSVRCSYLAPAA